MKNFIQFLVLILFISCAHKLSSREYESFEDNELQNFDLDLNSNGRLFLRIEVLDTGFKTHVKNVTGTWTLKNSSIQYRLDDTRSSIDSFFILKGYGKTFFGRAITFSQNLDTAFIFGTPSLVEKTIK